MLINVAPILGLAARSRCGDACQEGLDNLFSENQRELSVGVHRSGRELGGDSEAVALRHPVMPVPDGLGG